MIGVRSASSETRCLRLAHALTLTHSHTRARTPTPSLQGSYYLILARILSCPSRMRSHAPDCQAAAPELTRPLLAQGDACSPTASPYGWTLNLCSLDPVQRDAAI